MDFFKKLPIWGQIAVLLVAVFVVYKLIKKVTTPTPPPPSPQPAGDDLQKLEQSGVKTSFPNSQYSAWSEKLQYALNYLNTDETAVYSIFNTLKNQADLLKLIQTFGSRKIEMFPFVFQTSTLSEAIQSQMDEDEITKLNGILAKKGINFNF